MSFKIIQLNLTPAYNFIGFIQQKIMNQLDFSPISQKDQESIDTFSFLHHPSHLHRLKHNQHSLQAARKMFQKLSRVSYNRQSYSFQLLKQFILFSSDQQTIQIHYKYTQFQLQQGIQYLENTYGMHVKLTMGKAFEDIKDYSMKKKTYQNPIHIQKLTTVCNKIMDFNRKQSCLMVINILRKFIQQKVVQQDQSIEAKQQIAKQLINNVQRPIKLQQSLEKLQGFQNLNASSKNMRLKLYGELTQSKSNKIKRQDLMKTAKYSNLSSQRLQNSHSKWKEEVQDVDSYQQQPQNDSPQIIIKSMNNQFGTYNTTEFLDSTRHNNRTGLNQNRCISTQITPIQFPKQYDIFRTKRKYQQGSIYRNSQSQKQRLDVTQNVVIIRSSKKHRREPDRYIRVPIISQKVKIIELLPDEDKKQKDNEQKKLKTQKTLSSRHKTNSIEQRESYKSSRNYEWKKQDYNIKQKLKMLQQKNHEKSYKQQDSQNCIGCKYCTLVKQMETYRLKRANSKPLKYI